jgi:hypothetical protein
VKGSTLAACRKGSEYSHDALPALAGLCGAAASGQGRKPRSGGATMPALTGWRRSGPSRARQATATVSIIAKRQRVRLADPTSVPLTYSLRNHTSTFAPPSGIEPATSFFDSKLAIGLPPCRISSTNLIERLRARSIRRARNAPAVTDVAWRRFSWPCSTRDYLSSKQLRRDPETRPVQPTSNEVHHRRQTQAQNTFDGSLSIDIKRKAA